MELITAESTLLLALGLGMLHALDADHIMAVSALTAKRPNVSSCMRFCSHWATGHGLALFSIAAGVFVLGAAIPETLSHWAETIVGAVLIIIGCSVLWEIARRGLQLQDHSRARDTHKLQRHQHNRNQKQDHSALCVGLLHGTAGSAPLLILLPISKMNSPLDAMSYVLLFALGVVLSMLIFGGLLARLYQRLSRWGDKAVIIIRVTVALSSMGFGGHLLYGHL